MEPGVPLRQAVHDIKNPLSTLVLQCELLAERMKQLGDAENETLARSIGEEATRIARMLDGLNHTLN